MKVAVVGSGITGLASAWLLGRKHRVTLFEQNERLGGHAHTVTVRHGDRSIAVDTGFIVYNDRNYPNLVALFRALDVPTEASDMSFSVSVDGGARDGAPRADNSADRRYALVAGALRGVCMAPEDLPAGLRPAPRSAVAHGHGRGGLLGKRRWA